MKKMILVSFLALMIALTIISPTFADNDYYSGNKYLLGDVNGDGIVDLKDVQQVGRQFGSHKDYDPYGFGNDEYNPDNDIVQDGKIDLKDYYLVCDQYGESFVVHLPNYDWEVIDHFNYWAKSYSHMSPECVWNFDTKGHCTMCQYYNNWFEFNNIGLFQGTKPFGWGSANKTWTPYLVLNDTFGANSDNYDFGFTLIDEFCEITGCSRLGVDIWFDIYLPSEGKTVVGEFYVYYYMAGAIWYCWPVGSIWAQDRSWQNETWYLVSYRPDQNVAKGTPAHKSYCINDLVTKYQEKMIQWTGFSYWHSAEFRLKAIDFTAEGSQYIINWTMDYGYLYHYYG